MAGPEGLSQQQGSCTRNGNPKTTRAELLFLTPLGVTSVDRLMMGGWGLDTGDPPCQQGACALISAGSVQSSCINASGDP